MDPQNITQPMALENMKGMPGKAFHCHLNYVGSHELIDLWFEQQLTQGLIVRRKLPGKVRMMFLFGVTALCKPLQ